MFSETSPTIEALRESGALLVLPDEQSFDTECERVTWNRRLASTRKPVAIATVRTADEAASAIRIASENGIAVSVRGGGHNYEAAALRDGTLLLDLGALDSITIDHSGKTARVGVGVQDGPLSEELAAAGFAFPVGHCRDVSLSGYLLAGGFGWNAGAWGAACGSVISLEMVTAEGQLIEASSDTNPDMFWAARGHGPGFFAAITAYTLALHPLPATAFEFGVVFPLSDVERLAEWLTSVVESSSPEVETGALLTLDGDSGAPIIHVRATACGDSEAAARAKVAAFGKLPEGVETLGQPTQQALPFTDLFRFSRMPSGMRVAADHSWSDSRIGEVVLALRDVAPPNATSSINIVALGGHRPVALPEAALSITGNVGVGIYGMWSDAADDARIQEWVAHADDALAPLRTGRYVGEAALTVDRDRRAQCFTPEAFARLEALRVRHDPRGVFARWP